MRALYRSTVRRTFCKNILRNIPKDPNTRRRTVSGFLARFDDPNRADDVAILNSFEGRAMTYGECSAESKRIAATLEKKLDPSVHSIGCYIGGHSDYVLAMLAVWRLNKIFIPLGVTHPEKELKYFVSDSGIGSILYSSNYGKYDVNTDNNGNNNDNDNSKSMKNKDISSTNISAVNILNLNVSLFDMANETLTSNLTRKDNSDINSDSNSNNNNNIVGHSDNIVVHSDNIVGNSDNIVGNSDNIVSHSDALILYTSGTTGRPKGVVHTREGLESLILSLTTAWEYSPSDHILHFLPLYHLHGLLNKLLCVLSAGGSVEFSPNAKPDVLWNRLIAESTFVQTHTDDENKNEKNKNTNKILSLFMAVPTVYAKMIEKSYNMSPTDAQKAKSVLQGMRMNVSGSAALPDTVMDAWKNLSGQVLLERYGMTELGMVLSNPLHGKRLKGCVGKPLPYMNCRIVDDNEVVVGEKEVEVSGELRVKGPGVFRAYLNLPEVTATSFDKEGWFKTGDVAVHDEEGNYRLYGRQSTDIIKCSGFKLSALEVEREILGHAQISEAVVIGLPDDILGEKIIALITLRDLGSGSGSNSVLTNQLDKNNKFQSLKTLRSFLADKLAAYKQPQDIFIVDNIPRNNLGKVNKKSILKDLKII